MMQSVALSNAPPASWGQMQASFRPSTGSLLDDGVVSEAVSMHFQLSLPRATNNCAALPFFQEDGATLPMVPLQRDHSSGGTLCKKLPADLVAWEASIRNLKQIA